MFVVITFEDQIEMLPGNFETLGMTQISTVLITPVSFLWHISSVSWFSIHSEASERVVEAFSSFGGKANVLQNLWIVAVA